MGQNKRKIQQELGIKELIKIVFMMLILDVVATIVMKETEGVIQQTILLFILGMGVLLLINAIDITIRLKKEAKRRKRGKRSKSD